MPPFRPTEMSSVFGITYDLIGKDLERYSLHLLFIHSPLAECVICGSFVL